MKLHTFTSTTEFTEIVKNEIEKAITEAIDKNGIARMALSGGNSPKQVYQKLSHSKKINWSKVHIYMVDERYVNADSDESNAKMIQESLLKDLPASHFYSFDTSLPLDECAKNYEKLLHAIQKEPLFDLTILGLGADGHTASLFPDIPELEGGKKWVVATRAKNYPTEQRLTLTFSAILNSKKIIFIVQGKEKKEIIGKWLQEKNDYHKLPAAKILEHSGIEIFYLER